MVVMATRANKPISVTIGPFAEKIERRIRDGEYSSASEVVRAGLRALDRGDELFDEILKAKVLEALADPRPSISSEEMRRQMDSWHAERVKRDS